MMCIRCIASEKEKLIKLADDLSNRWKVDKMKEVPMMHNMGDLLEDIRDVLKECPAFEEDEPEGIEVFVADLAMQLGAAHYPIRSMMTIFEPNNIEASDRHLIFETRRFLDTLYTCLKINEPPTMFMAAQVEEVVEGLKDHLRKKMEDAGVIEKQVLN